MTIELKHLMPIHLKERIDLHPSEIWGKTLQFFKGENIQVIAPSGTGKTTLIHILYKLRTDYSGSVFFDDHEVRLLSGNELAGMRQQTISIVFQDLRLFLNLTARENIEINRVLHQPIYKSEIIDQMAECLGISHILNRQTILCSYGEQQRIAIIRALIQPFSWLIMDEPFSHLDKENAQKAARLINEECAKRQAGCFITGLDDTIGSSKARKFFL